MAIIHELRENGKSAVFRQLKTILFKYKEGKSRIHQISLSCNPLPPVGYGGIETVVTNLSRGLVAIGLPVICYSPEPFKIDGCSHWATLMESTTGPKNGSLIANSLEHLENVVEGIKQNYRCGDIIHLHHAEQYPYVKKFRNQWLIHCNFAETAHWRKVGLDRNIIYPSRALKKELHLIGTIVPHGIDLSVFKPKHKKNGNYLFYAGRISEDKGVHIAADAAKIAGLQFRVAGPLVDMEYAETFFEDVTYLGELSGVDLVRQYQGALATIYMTQYNEPFGLSVVESLACGTPVLTTGYGGTGETVIHGKCGFFCRDKAEILKALDRLNRVRAEDCIAQGIRYSLQNMASGYMEFYRTNFAS